MIPLDDRHARLVLLVGLVVVLPLTAFHRVRSNTGEPLDRRQEGLFVLVTLRPLGVAHLLAVLAYVANPGWMAWSSFPVPGLTRWIGTALGIVAAVLLAWTLRCLGKNLTDTVVTRREHTLVTHGPYRFVRHPFYLAVTLTVLANALVAANGFLLLTALLVLALLVVRTDKEEENLLARFGDRYRSYMESTGRFLPRDWS